MKTIFSILLIFATLTMLNGQSIEVEYIYKKHTTKDVDASNNPMVDEIRSIRADKFVSFTLLHSERRSTFEKSSPEKQYNNGMSDLTFTYENDKYFKDFKKNEIRSEQHFINEYKITGELPKFEWNLSNETTYVLGYKCYKATMYDCTEDREWVAWYTTSIPISNGPLHTGGLPGLILKLEFGNGSMSMVAENVNYFSDNCYKIDVPDYKKTITLSEFCEKKRTIFSNLKEQALNGN